MLKEANYKRVEAIHRSSASVRVLRTSSTETAAYMPVSRCERLPDPGDILIEVETELAKCEAKWGITRALRAQTKGTWKVAQS
jgi:hypothetical protein